MEVKLDSPTVTSAVVVLNIIWWMIMIAAIGHGALHLGSCPVQPNIPVYLIVLGLSSLSAMSLSYTRDCFRRDDIGFSLITTCAAVLHLFTFIWVITGSYWVYSVYLPSSEPGTDRYCQEGAYQYAFVLTSLIWIILCITLFCCCCFCLLTCCKSVRDEISSFHSISYGGMSDTVVPV